MRPNVPVPTSHTSISILTVFPTRLVPPGPLPRYLFIIYYQSINMPSRQAQLVQSSTMETVEGLQEAEALQGQVDAATQRAIDSRADNQPPTTKQAYSRPQAMWTVSPLAP